MKIKPENPFNNYNKKLKPFARVLRKASTLAEINFWVLVLKARQLCGYQFHRQRPIGKYVADFFCKELKLIIELDGLSHEWRTKEDKFRQKELEQLGYTVLRFSDNQIMYELDSVKLFLKNWIDDFERNNPDVLKIKHRKKRTSPLPPL
jgi:very-short-patch-repair endonuclease